MLCTGHTVSANGSHFTFRGHHVSHHQQVADIDFQTSAVQGQLQFVDDGLSSGFNAKVVVDFDDVVGVGAGPVNAFQLADTLQVAANGRQVVLTGLVVQLHVRSLDAGDALQPHVTDLFLKLQQHGVGRRVLGQVRQVVFRVNTGNQGQRGGVLLLVRLNEQSRGLFQFVLNFHGCHVLLLEVAFVELQHQAALRNVGLQRSDVDRGRHFNSGGQFLCSVSVLNLARRHANGHRWRLGHLSCVHDLNDTWQTLGHVDCGHTGIVERTHGHLRARFANGLRRDDARRLVGVNAGFVQRFDGFLDDLLCLWLGQFLLASAVACKGQIRKDSVCESAGAQGLGGFFERLVHRVAGKFVLQGLGLSLLVVGLKIHHGLGAGPSTPTSGQTHFGDGSTRVTVTVSSFLGGCKDGCVDFPRSFGIRFASLGDVVGRHRLDIVPLTVIGELMSEVLGHAEVHQLLLRCTLDHHQASPPVSSPSNSQPPKSSSRSSRSTDSRTTSVAPSVPKAESTMTSTLNGEPCTPRDGSMPSSP